MKKFFAEVIGTFMLVFIGTGAVVFGNGTEGLGHLGIALAFGLSIVAAAYSIGTVSGAHLNPAVSIAMFVNKRLSSKDLVNYIAAQVVGAVLASATVLFLLSNSGMSTASLGENALAKGVTPFGGFLFEVIASFIFILVIMTVTSATKGNGKIAGLVIGLSLTLIILVGLNITGLLLTQLVAWHLPSLLVVQPFNKFGSLSWLQLSVVFWLQSLQKISWIQKSKKNWFRRNQFFFTVQGSSWFEKIHERAVFSCML